jgi:hypothetical protein
VHFHRQKLIYLYKIRLFFTIEGPVGGEIVQKTIKTPPQKIILARFIAKNARTN